MWFELQAANISVSTGPTAAAACADRATTNSPTNSDSNSVHVENSSHIHADQAQYHSKGMGMGLYYLDACIPAQTTAQQTAVHIITICSPTAVRPVFEVHSNPAGSADSPSCGVAQPLCTNPTTRNSSAASLQQQLDSSTSCTDSSSGGGGSLHLQQQQPTWSPHGMPRHAWLPQWHFDMLADQQRNNAYEDAIR